MNTITHYHQPYISLLGHVELEVVMKSCGEVLMHYYY
jgi:hypothetical protein